MIESKKHSEDKKGLVVYSEFGAGTCFSFSFQCDINTEQCSPLSPSEKKDKIERKFISIRNCIPETESKISLFSLEKILEQNSSKQRTSCFAQSNENNNSIHSISYSENMNSSIILQANRQFLLKNTLLSKLNKE